MPSPNKPPVPLPKAEQHTNVLSTLTWRSMAVVTVLAALVAAVLHPIFKPTFVELLGRTLFIGTMLLLAYQAAGVWRQTLVPRWIMQIIVVILAAPCATLMVYVVRMRGDMAAFAQSWPSITGFIALTASAALIGLVMALGALYREREARLRAQLLEYALERETLERQAVDAQLNLLQAQIEPHFLFNTLANIQELVESGSPRAAPVFRSLIAYLKAAMPQLHQRATTLGNEETLVRSYLELMLMRMPDRLQFKVEFDAMLRSMRFPAMALLTLVENSIRHGIDPSVDGGTIEVGARRIAPGIDKCDVLVWVLDTGVGMSETAARGTGLTNLQERLKVFFGQTTLLEMSENSPQGLRAEIRLKSDPA